MKEEVCRRCRDACIGHQTESCKVGGKEHSRLQCLQLIATIFGSDTHNLFNLLTDKSAPKKRKGSKTLNNN